MADMQTTPIEAATREAPAAKSAGTVKKRRKPTSSAKAKATVPSDAQALIVKALNLATLLTVMSDADDAENPDRDALGRCVDIARDMAEELLCLVSDHRDALERKVAA